MTVQALLHAVARTMPGLEPSGVAAPGAGLDVSCTGVTHDSRQVRPGTVFVALRGRHADGIAFVPGAVAAGATAIVADRPPGDPDAVPWLTVPDARTALAALACEFHGHPSRDLRVIGITGTNGKTTTSHLVRAVLEASGQPCGLLGTVGYHVGGQDLPAARTTPEAPDLQALLRRMAAAGSRACVMEVSSHALALRRVDGTQFGAAVFTNLTRDHLDFHDSMEEYFAAKRRLFEMLPPGAPAAINLDDPRGALLVPMVSRPVTFAATRAADVMPGPVEYSFEGLRFEIRTPQGVVRVVSTLAGRPNVSNILAAVAVTIALDVPIPAIEAGLANLRGVAGRFQIVTTAADDISVVVDYAHTDDALRNLLETARTMAPRRVITVFGAGGDRDRTKRPLMGLVAARLSDLVIVTSDNPRTEDPARIIDEVRRGAEPEMRLSGAEVVSVVDRRAAIHEAIARATSGDVVLIAGKGHETCQEIGGSVLPFDDAAVAREALEARRPARKG